MFIPHSLESQVLLACARLATEPQVMQTLVRPHLDWQGIVERAEYFGIAPLVYAKLKSMADCIQIPAAIMERLEDAQRRHALYNMNLYHKLREILIAFSQADISVVVLKGAALAALVYEDIALRPMNDLDLLVKQEDLERADHLLQTLYYMPDESHQSQAWYRAHMHHLAPYVARDLSLVLELHHHIVPPPASLRIPISRIWQHTCPARIAHSPTLILAPECLLLHLCLHLAYADHFIGKLRDLVDLAEVIRQYRGNIDWDQLMRDAQAYEAVSYLYYALWVARELVGAEVPTETLRHLKAALRSSRFEDLALKFMARYGVLRHHQRAFSVPEWAISDTCAILLDQGGTGTPIQAVCLKLYQRFLHSARQAAPHLQLLAPIYAHFFHPLFLLLRALGRAARSR